MIEQFSSLSLEQVALISMIEDLSLFHPNRDILKVEHFFDESSKSIYRGIRDLDDRSEHITIETLANWVLMNDNNASQSLTMLLTVAPIPSLSTIVGQLIELSNKRNLYLVTQQMQIALEDKSNTSFNVIKMMEEAIMSVDVVSGTKAKSYGELALYYENQPPLAVMKSHTFLDQMFGRGGVSLGGLILVMGSPEAGKTVFGVQILEYIAKVAPVLFFAFEFTVREYVGLTGEKGRDIYLDYKNPKHEDAIDVEVVGESKDIAVKGVSDNFYIVDDGYDISDIERELKIWHKKGVRIALIDSQMRVENAYGNFNTIESMESDKFSRLAKICHRYEMTIFFICQQGKNDTKTGQHTPMNSKKGAHEAHAIIYIDKEKPKYDENELDENRFKRWIEVSKNKFTGKHTKREHYLRPSDLTLHKKNNTDGEHTEVEYQEEAAPVVVKDDGYQLPNFDDTDMPVI